MSENVDTADATGMKMNGPNLTVSDQMISEATYKDGEKHGANISIHQDGSITFTLHKKNSNVN